MAQQTTSDPEYEKAILWVPDPNSPAGWIRRKVWPDQEKPARNKPPLGFPMPVRRTED